MINFFSKYRVFFYSANSILIFLYLFPCSLIGYFLYGNCKIQPQIHRDLFFSSNHTYAFALLSIIAWLTYARNLKINLIFYYLFFLSITLEILQIPIPVRSFQWSDIFANILGVSTIFIFYEIFKKKNYKK